MKLKEIIDFNIEFEFIKMRHSSKVNLMIGILFFFESSIIIYIKINNRNSFWEKIYIKKEFFILFLGTISRFSISIF